MKRSVVGTHRGDPGRQADSHASRGQRGVGGRAGVPASSAGVGAWEGPGRRGLARQEGVMDSCRLPFAHCKGRGAVQ